MRCVSSIARALTAEDEIIVVDDGSVEPVKMGERGVIGGNDERGEKGGRGRPDVIVVRHEKNLGLPSARNSGLKVARGQFVTFVDSDDEVLPEVYEHTLKAMVETESDVGVFGVNVRYAGEGYQIFDLPPNKYYGELRPEDVRDLYRRRLFYYSCNKVFRRAFFDEHHLRFNPLGVPCEDAIFNVSLVMEKAKWVTVPFIGYIYYRYDGTICSNYKPTYVEGTRACTAKWREYKATIPNAYEIFGSYDETSEEEIAKGQWMNVWRRGSPYGVVAKWKYASAHSNVLGHCTPIVFLKMAVFMFLRLHFYIKPIRIWHQKRGMIRIGAKIEPLR